MYYTVYEIETGRILFTGSGPSVTGMGLTDGTDLIEQSSDPDRQYVSNGTLLDKGTQPTKAHVFNYNTKQWELSTTILEVEIANRRNTLLQQSDWTQLPDVPLATKEAWAVYRQALRDITQQPGYPTEVNWPVAPT